MQRCGIHGCVVVGEEAVSESLSNAVCDVGGVCGVGSSGLRVRPSSCLGWSTTEPHTLDSFDRIAARASEIGAPYQPPQILSSINLSSQDPGGKLARQNQEV